MPLYAAFFMVFTLANVGMPGTSGFIGEFLTMLGAFLHNSWLAIFSATGVILSAAYALFLYRRIIFGALVKPSLKTIQDLTPREIALLAPLVIITIGLGIYPKPVFDVTTPAVAKLINDNKTALAMDKTVRKVAIVQKEAAQ
jgi:NADH-quinone oxidoreductase subunit M